MPEVAECFREFSAEEISALKKGEEVWVDGEPYHLNGKVYGYTRIGFSGRRDPVFPERLFKLADPKKLEALVKQHGDLILSPIAEDEKRAFEVFQKSWEEGNYQNN